VRLTLLCGLQHACLTQLPFRLPRPPPSPHRSRSVLDHPLACPLGLPFLNRGLLHTLPPLCRWVPSSHRRFPRRSSADHDAHRETPSDSRSCRDGGRERRRSDRDSRVVVEGAQRDWADPRCAREQEDSRGVGRREAQGDKGGCGRNGCRCALLSPRSIRSLG
jgi:hypothetical protein